MKDGSNQNQFAYCLCFELFLLVFFGHPSK